MIEARHLVVVMAMFLASRSGHARAADTKIFPGNFCRQVGGTDAAVPLGPAVVNLSQETIEVSCPIIRDDSQSIEGWNTIEVFVRDGSDEAVVSCTGYTRKPDGTTVFTDNESTDVEGVTPGNLWQILTIGGGGMFSAVPNGTYGLLCTIPPGIENLVGGYRVVEP